MKKGINGIEEFSLLTEIKLKDAELWLKKEQFSNEVINKTDLESLKYYTNKRDNLINQFNDSSFHFRIYFNDIIEINKEDFKQLMLLPKVTINYIQQIENSKEHLINPDVKSELIKQKKELQEYYKNRIKDLENSIKLSYYHEIIKTLKGNNLDSSEGDLVFLNNDKINSEFFFKYLIDKWLKSNEPKVKTALKHITYKMWYKNNHENKETPYKIRCSLNDFTIYWNKNFKDICELNQKKPKLNVEDLTSSSYYSNRFDYYLSEYTRG